MLANRASEANWEFPRFSEKISLHRPPAEENVNSTLMLERGSPMGRLAALKKGFVAAFDCRFGFGEDMSEVQEGELGGLVLGRVEGRQGVGLDQVERPAEPIGLCRRGFTFVA